MRPPPPPKPCPSFASLAIALVMAASAAAAEEPAPAPGCAKAAADKVQSFYDGVRDVAASFEQTTRSVAFSGPGLALDEPSRGHVVFAKPGRMRWEYQSPEPSVVVSDGKTLWLWNPGAMEAQRMAVSQGFPAGAALSFLLGEGSLLDSFQVSAGDCSGETVDLTLVPKEPAGYERLGMTVAAATGEVRATTVIDLFGNETRIAFSKLERNRGPAPETFRFEPPEGAEVIDLGPPPPGS